MRLFNTTLITSFAILSTCLSACNNTNKGNIDNTNNFKVYDYYIEDSTYTSKISPDGIEFLPEGVSSNSSDWVSLASFMLLIENTGNENLLKVTYEEELSLVDYDAQGAMGPEVSIEYFDNDDYGFGGGTSNVSSLKIPGYSKDHELLYLTGQNQNIKFDYSLDANNLKATDSEASYLIKQLTFQRANIPLDLWKKQQWNPYFNKFENYCGITESDDLTSTFDISFEDENILGEGKIYQAGVEIATITVPKQNSRKIQLRGNIKFNNDSEQTLHPLTISNNELEGLFLFYDIDECSTGFFATRVNDWSTDELTWRTVYEFDATKESLLDNYIYNKAQLTTY